MAVAENRNTNLLTLRQLAEDGCDDVRYGLAECPHVPAEILLRLAEDENPYVRFRSMKTMQLLGLPGKLCLLTGRPLHRLYG